MIKEKIDKFTESQEIGLSKLEAFLSTKIDHKNLATRVFVLTGKAGTGKTTIIKYALKKYLEEDKNNINKHDINFDMFSTPKVIGITQSHKAKNVLSNSIHVCKTFAASFGLEQTYKEDGSVKFERPKYQRYTDKVLPCDLPVKAFVHDECSMYDRSMLNYVLDLSHLSSKIIFMGDPGQIPPVSVEGDKDSPIFDLDLPDENKHTLVERVRQTEGNPILELSDIIYEEIFGSNNLARVIEAMAKENLIDNKGITHVSRKDFLEHYKQISKDYTDTKVVAYRNKTVDDFNKYCRKYIHNNPDQEFIKGEIIYMSDTYYNQEKGNTYFCYNSDEYIIDEVANTTVEGIATMSLFINTDGHDHLPNGKRYKVPVVHSSGKSEFNRKSSQLAYFAKNALQHKAQKWKAFFNFTQNWGKVSYGYCDTGHKIQGSGYKNIYVDVNDILTVSMITPKRKLQSLYTAITRATDLVILIKK